jgi:multiple sugar transport system substrate-binding protein
MGDNTNRRKVLKGVAAASILSIAGCSSGGEGDQDSTNNAQESLDQIDFSSNWEDRRLASLEEWPAEQRQQVPSEDTSFQAWKDSGTLQSAPWQPPEGWEDTPAGDVDTLQILNDGSLDFDPATVATMAMFEEATGIEIEVLTPTDDQVIPQSTAIFQNEASQPHVLSVIVPSSFSSFAENGYLERTEAVMSESDMWDPYFQSSDSDSFSYDGTTYLGPNIQQGSLFHVRPDLLREQDVPDDTISDMVNGKATWDHLEEVMEAFEDSDKFGFAYRGNSRIYTVRDWKKLMYQAGGDIIQDDDSVVYNSDAGVTALSKMIEWKEKGWVPDAVSSYGQGDIADGWISGQFATASVFGDLVPRSLEEFEKGSQYVATLPLAGNSDAPNPTRSGVIAPVGVGVNKFADIGHKLAGMMYIDAKWSYPTQWWEFTHEGNSAFMESVFEQATEIGVSDFAQDRGEATELGRLEIYPQQRALTQTLTNELQIAISGGKSAQEALDAAQDTADQVLQQ